MWKFVKAKLRSQYYSDFSDFIKTIDSITGSTHGSAKGTMDSLIGKGVQLFKDLEPVTDNTFRIGEKKAS